mmetsp:Transcript_4415/g.10604  ORF Transcript_4415/g.10604 Transcript_4415/m.10604 type:complete len:408 (-) Transcript_4415:4344-5567(-)
MRRMTNDSVPGQGWSGQRGSTTRASPWFSLLLAKIMFSRASAERVIESNKSVAMEATAWILALVSTLVSLFAMVFVIVCRENKIVTVGQPFFLCMICFGSLLMSVSIYFDAGSIEEIPGIEWAALDKLCIAQLWCLYCGMLIVLAALICKLWRAEKVCQFRKGQRILVRHVLWPFALIILLEIILLAVATAVCPPVWGEVLVDPFDAYTLNNSTLLNLNITLVDTADKMPKCFASPQPATIALQAISHALIVISQIVVIWMAYQTRRIPEEMVDTKRVYYLMLCQFILYIPYLLLEYGVIPSRRAYHFTGLIFPFLFSVTAVGFLVFPKVYYVFYYRRHGRLPESVVSIVMTKNVYVSGVSSTRGSSKSSVPKAATNERISGFPTSTARTSTIEVDDSIKRPDHENE